MNGLLFGTQEIIPGLAAKVPGMQELEIKLTPFPSPHEEPNNNEQDCESFKVQNDSVDCLIISEGISTLYRFQWQNLLSESFRVLKKDGVAWFDVLLADESISSHIPLVINNNQVNFIPQELTGLEIISHAGFHGIEIIHFEPEPVATLGAVEINRHLIRAYKGKQGPCFDFGHAVIYQGPWRSVQDDDGHCYERGVRTAVCEKTYGLLTREPYVGQFIGLPPLFKISPDQAPLFDCNTPAIRDHRITKGMKKVQMPSQDITITCEKGSGCC